MCTCGVTSIFKKIDTSNVKEIYKSIRELVPEQKFAYNIIMQFCKDTVKFQNSKQLKSVKPPLLIIHGGAGTGKSKLIKDIANSAEFFLRKSGDNPDHPYIIRAAPTGMAASLIDGVTLHSGFHLPFKNKFESLSDKIRDDIRLQLSNFTILIIDEISMMRSDMLQEVKQKSQIFGGVSICLFGDIMQLKPVKGNYIFEEPRDSHHLEYYNLENLWNLFDVIELNENHRQGNDKIYLDILRRIRIGEHTEEDVKVLKTRERDEHSSDLPKDAQYIYGTNKCVNTCNMKKLLEQKEMLETLDAVHVHPTIKNYHPCIKADGTINETGFMNRLYLKKI